MPSEALSDGIVHQPVHNELPADFSLPQSNRQRLQISKSE
ncbi:conserved hypothetical protein [Neisseria gonorrhoeae DGI2]|uniref:Uncharacterized protein n=1 Tax=Neisseria gonorrhoeae (strain NCCP11945) TaxID=521006 RepID=B4RNI3_NEIG2|nr:Hypothetical protein NGK_2007 [Neisseria gonorrhoeae NCCP11945]EFE05031.1 conserved hypothetical protein [Neisseria gonorrhoeae DGI2]